MDQPLPLATGPRSNVIEQSAEAVGDIGQFDIVCSHAVGQHVVQAFASLTARALAPGGVAVHVIDLSGHHWHRVNEPDLFRRFPE